jgi:predicted  nucleic acid-binding Zn-ribbon protein
MSVEIKVAKLETEVDIVKEDVREIKTELKVVHGRITDGQEKVMEKLTMMSGEANDAHDAIVDKMNTMDNRINGRISALERWRWMVLGGAIVVGYLLSMVPLDKMFG